MFPFLVPGRVGYDADRAHHQHSKQDQINIAATIVLTGLVVCQCYRGSVYVQQSAQGYSDPKFLGYADHMPIVGPAENAVGFSQRLKRNPYDALGQFGVLVERWVPRTARGKKTTNKFVTYTKKNNKEKIKPTKKELGI